MMSPFLEKYWKEACSLEFPRMILEDPKESWLQFYHNQLNSSKSRISEAGSRLRDSYRGEGKQSQNFYSLFSFCRAEDSSATDYFS